VSTAFDVLAQPTRRRILDLLLERPRLVGELSDELGLSQPGTSKHLKVLREAGLVRVRRDAQRRWYELEPAPLMAVDEWLTPYRWLWSERLDALERHLDSMDDEPASPTDGPASPTDGPAPPADAPASPTGVARSTGDEAPAT
jgi:DNA-binding transcriptional ArsR family regulator